MPWSWISAPLMCSDSLPCSCCVYILLGFINAKEGWGLSTVYQHVVGASQHAVIKARCGMKPPLILPYLSLHMAKPIGRELPTAQRLPLCFPPPFACVNYVSAGEAAMMRHAVVAFYKRMRTQAAWSAHNIGYINCIFNRGFQSSLARHGKDMGLVGSPHWLFSS